MRISDWSSDVCSSYLSTIATTSFFPSKPLGCYGDGGALFTADAKLARSLRRIARHGQDGRYNHVVVGINSRLDTVQAAVLLAKMAIFEEEIDRSEEHTSELQSLMRIS